MSVYAVRIERLDPECTQPDVSWCGTFHALEKAIASAEISLKHGALEADVYEGYLMGAGDDGKPPLYRARVRVQKPTPRRRLSGLAGRLPVAA